MDRCPMCKSTEVNPSEEINEAMQCSSCGHQSAESSFLPTRAEIGLSKTNCETCNRRLSWGCGHSPEQEIKALAHLATAEHLERRCWHYNHSECDADSCDRAGLTVSGYAAFVKH